MTSVCTPFRTCAALVLAGACAVAHTQAGGEAQLTALINAYRDAPQSCEGRAMPRAEPLASSAALARVELERGGTLGDALAAVGYQAATSRLLWISGAADASAAMAVLTQQHCAALLASDLTEIGISRSGRHWRIVLARPLLAETLGDWRSAGRAVLERANAARAEPRRCGDAHFDAAAPLAWNERLAAAALAHSRDMAQRSTLGHAGSDGSRPADRATRHGYDWRAVGENVAGGQGSAAEVVDGWLRSPVHCANLMAPEYREMGAAYAREPGSRLHIYWTQLLGTQR